MKDEEIGNKRIFIFIYNNRQRKETQTNKRKTINKKSKENIDFEIQRN